MALYARDPAQPKNVRRKIKWHPGDEGYPFGADTVHELLAYPPVGMCQDASGCDNARYYSPKPNVQANGKLVTWHSSSYCSVHKHAHSRGRDLGLLPASARRGSRIVSGPEDTPTCPMCGSAPVQIRDRHDGSYAVSELCHRCTARLRNHGLDLTRFKELFSEQEGNCAICGRPLPSWDTRGRYQINVDHDHSLGCHPTGFKSCDRCRRGLVHASCNVAIGHFGDDPAAMRAAAQYIETWRARAVV